MSRFEQRVADAAPHIVRYGSIREWEKAIEVAARQLGVDKSAFPIPAYLRNQDFRGGRPSAKAQQR